MPVVLRETRAQRVQKFPARALHALPLWKLDRRVSQLQFRRLRAKTELANERVWTQDSATGTFHQENLSPTNASKGFIAGIAKTPVEYK